MNSFLKEILIIISFVAPIILVGWFFYRFLISDMIREMDEE
jgi:hypothetical protein